MTGFWTLHAPAALAVALPVLMMPGLDFAAVSQARMGERIGLGLLVCVLHFSWFAGVALVLERIGARPDSGPVLRIGAGVVAIVLAAAGVMALRG